MSQSFVWVSSFQSIIQTGAESEQSHLLANQSESKQYLQIIIQYSQMTGKLIKIHWEQCCMFLCWSVTVILSGSGHEGNYCKCEAYLKCNDISFWLRLDDNWGSSLCGTVSLTSLTGVHLLHLHIAAWQVRESMTHADSKLWLNSHSHPSLHHCSNYISLCQQVKI